MIGIITMMSLGYGGQLSFPVHLDPNALSSSRDGKSLSLEYNGAFPGRDIGEPALPVMVKFFVLPDGARVDSVIVEDLDRTLIFRDAEVPTLQWPELPDLPKPDVVPAKITHGVFPEQPAEIGYLGDMRGVRIAAVRLYPLSYDLDAKRVYFNRSFVIRIYYSGARNNGRCLVTEPWKRFIDALVENPDVPKLPEGGVDYLIITNQALKPAFEQLLDMRRARGLSARIATVEWIASVYPGADMPERIRNFLKDAYENWGVSFVLIGGDQYIVPFRMAYQPIGYHAYGDSVPTDLYYACLDGDWNPDGDNDWGEWPDTVDFFPDIFVARIPFRHSYEVGAFCEKLRAYEESPRAGVTRAVVHAADLFSPGDGVYYARRVARRFPQTFRVDSMYEALLGDITVQQVSDTLNQGPGYFFMMGHGNWWKTQIDRSTGVCFRLQNAANLTNKASPYFLTILSCDGNSVYESSVGKAMFVNPEGGAVASFGSGKLDFASYTVGVIESLYVNVFQKDLSYAGMADMTARAYWAPFAVSSPLFRHLLMAYNLQGDPATDLWTEPPGNLTAWHDPVVQDRFEVLVMDGKEPVSGARVTLWTGDYIVTQRTGGDGRALFTGLSVPGDTVFLSVDKHNYLPITEKLPVSHTGPQLAAELRYVGPPDAYRQGVILAGDTGKLVVKIKNLGSEETGPMRCHLLLDTLMQVATMFSNSSSLARASAGPGERTWAFSLPNIPPGAEREAVLTVAASLSIPPVAQLDFDLTATPENQANLYHKSFRITGFGPDVRLTGVKSIFEAAGGAPGLSLDLRNSGPGPARDIRCIGLAGEDTLCQAYVSVLEPGDNTAYSTQLRIPVSISSLTLLLEVGGVPRDTYRIVPGDPPPPPDSLVATPDLGGVSLFWAKAPGAAGYKVYRADRPEGPYHLVSDMLSGACFKDLLKDDSVHYWRVASVDSFLNEGEASEPVFQQRNPSLGPFAPIEAPGIGYPSAQAADLDPDYPGKELVVAGYWEDIHVFTAQGNPLPGWPKHFPGGIIYGTPAIGDLNQDGLPEVVVAVNMEDGAYIYTYDNRGNILEGWPRFASGDRIIFPPVLGDVDGDGSPEVIVKGEGAIIYVFYGDSTKDSSFDTGSGNALFPAVADLDGDGKAEIVAPAQDGLIHVFRENWSELPGFPVSVDSLAPYYGGVCIADVDPAPGPEIVFEGALSGKGTYLAVIYTSEPGFVRPPVMISPAVSTTPPVVADLDQDNKPNIILMVRDSMVICSHDGVPLLRKGVRLYFDNWPAAGFAAAGDINGDGQAEVIFGAWNGFLHAVDAGGNEIPGFPIQASLGSDWGGNTLVACPLLSDLDENGTLNLFMPSGARYLYAWDLGVKPQLLEWPSVRHDRWNTGFYRFTVPEAKTASVKDGKTDLSLSLSHPKPNPTGDRVMVSFSLPRSARISLRLYDLTGRRVMNVIDGKMAGGAYSMTLDMASLPAGVYFLRLDHPRGNFVEKITKIRGNGSPK